MNGNGTHYEVKSEERYRKNRGLMNRNYISAWQMCYEPDIDVQGFISEEYSMQILWL